MKIFFIIILFSIVTFADTPPPTNIFKLNGNGQTGLVNDVSGTLSALAPGSNGNVVQVVGGAFVSQALSIPSYAFMAPLSLSGSTVSISQAGASSNGYLSSTDWNTFNSKEVAVTFIDSLVKSGSNVSLVNDSASPGNSKYYGTSSGGTLGYFTLPNSAVWGQITGTLSNQTDLQSALNAKQNTLTPGSISTSTTGVSVGSGASSTVGPNVTVNVQTASGSQPGLLSSTDWSTFNGKQPAFGTQTANTVYAGPSSGSAATPGFRSLVANDIPSLSSLYCSLTGCSYSGNVGYGFHNITNVQNITASNLILSNGGGGGVSNLYSISAQTGGGPIYVINSHFNLDGNPIDATSALNYLAGGSISEGASPSVAGVSDAMNFYLTGLAIHSSFYFDPSTGNPTLALGTGNANSGTPATIQVDNTGAISLNTDTSSQSSVIVFTVGGNFIGRFDLTGLYLPIGLDDQNQIIAESPNTRTQYDYNGNQVCVWDDGSQNMVCTPQGMFSVTAQGTISLTSSAGDIQLISVNMGANTPTQILGLDSSNNVSSFAAVAYNGKVLQSNGTTWVAVNPYTNPMTTLGDVTYGGASGVATRLAGNITMTKKFLTQTGSGSASVAPGWNTIVAADIPGKAPYSMPMSTGALTAVSANEIVGSGKTVNAVTIQSGTLAAAGFTCTGNPTFKLLDCGTSAGTCTSGTTTLVTVTLTAANTQTAGTVNSASLAAGHFWAWEVTAGTCAALNAAGTAEANSTLQ